MCILMLTSNRVSDVVLEVGDQTPTGYEAARKSSTRLPNQRANERTVWIADVRRSDGNRFVVRADEKLTAFLELESAIKDFVSSQQSHCPRIQIA